MNGNRVNESAESSQRPAPGAPQTAPGSQYGNGGEPPISAYAPLQAPGSAYMQTAVRYLVHKDKVPYYINGTKRNGTLDTPEDWSKLSTLQQATDAYVSGDYDGIGFALGPDGAGGYWQGIDYDDISEYQLSDLANTVPGYVEISPSGNGAHAIGYGRHFAALGSNGSGIEAYASGRYFTVTGDMIRDTGLVDLAGFVEEQLVPRHSAHRTVTGTQDTGTVQVDAKTVTELRSALNAIPADDEGTWFRMGMALKELGPVGRELWLTWSQQSAKHRPLEDAKKWDSFEPRDTSYRAVFAEAQRRGWVNPKSNAAQRHKFQQIGEGAVDLSSFKAPSMVLSMMLNSLVLISAEKTVVAFRENPAICAAPANMRTLLLHNKTTIKDLNKKGEEVVKDVPTFNLWLNDKKKLVAYTMTFDPSQGEFCRSPDGRSALNLWRDRPHTAPENWQAWVQPFVEHIEYLVPVKEERERFLDWLAHIEQKPGELPHAHYLMIATQQGVGRNWLSSLLACIWRRHVALDFDLKQSLDSGFNGQLSRKLLAVCDEINEGGMRERWKHQEKLKSMVTVYERFINVKYGLQHSEKNCCRWLLFSNYETALPLHTDDRRWNIIRNPSEPRDADYYNKLYKLLDNDQFVAAVRELLRTRDISNFNPGARAELNEAKKAVIAASMSDDDERAAELVDTWPYEIICAEHLFHHVFGFPPGRADDADTARRWKLLPSIAAKAKIEKLPKIFYWNSSQYKLWALRNAQRWRKAERHELANGLGWSN